MAPTGYHLTNINGLHRAWIKPGPCYATNNLKAIVLVIDALVSHAETNEVAIAFDQYIRQAIDRTCTKVKVNASKRPKGPKWYDRKLRLKRSEAIKAGENMNIGKDNDDLLVCCRE